MNRTTLSFPLLIALLLLFAAPVSADDDLDLPADKICDGPTNEMMHRHLLGQVNRANERWAAEYEKLASPDEIAAYQLCVRERFLDAIGGLPDRTPLEPRITGTVSRSGYRVEKVLFQSQPNHYVTGLLFLPDSERFEPPYPGVLVPCGHSKEGKGYESYQSAGALFALNGLAALVFDPIDQGERGQYLGPGGWPELCGTTGHSTVGMGCILLGQNTARFEIWDGMRAIDYLQSRPEVDPKKIGCTGCSGGGTQTSYLMALDDRIQAAAPSCYLTSMARLLATIGPQDAEQNIFGQLRFGPRHADFILARAPSPVLVLASTQDFFDIGGTWDTFRRAKRTYTRLGRAADLDILESDDKHGYNQLHREGAARWMRRRLLGDDRQVVEPKIELLVEEEYQCLPDGKVMNLPGARSVYDLNEEYEAELAPRRAAAWAKEDKAPLVEQVRQLTGIRKLADLPRPEVEIFGTCQKSFPSPAVKEVEGKNGNDNPPAAEPHGETNPQPNSLSTGEAICRVEKLLIRPEKGVALPALLFLPETNTEKEKPDSDRVVLYVNEQGKSTGAAPGGEIEKLVRSGRTVLAVDLRGTGQTAPASRGFYKAEWKDAAMAYMLGRSYVGMRAEDVLLCARYAAQRLADGRPESVDLIAVGNIGIPALHAAALEPQLFHSVCVSRSLRSWTDFIRGRLNRFQMTDVVHGALTCYDLPDLAATLADKLTIEQPVDAMGKAIEDGNGPEISQSSSN